jgi:lipopolysaccharide heptosyltransferase II
MRQFQRILIVNPFGIGDVLFSTPMIAALKEHFPGVSISFIGNARTAPFLKNDPRIDQVFSYERDEFFVVYRRSPWQFFLKWKRFVDELRAGQFDLALDLSLNSGLGLALKLAGIPKRVGHDFKGRGRFLTDRSPLKGYEGRHVVEHHFELLRSLGIQAVPGKMTFPISKEDEAWAGRFLKEKDISSARIVGLYPGGGASWGTGASVRLWATEKYAKLADKVIENTSAIIILMGDKADLSRCEDIARRMSRRPVIAAGETNLGQSAALMKCCRFLIMNDGGAMHVAAALGVRNVVVFGPVDEKTYGPFPISQQIIAAKDLPCRPCYRNFRMSDCKHLSCLTKLTVDEVYKRVEGLS